MRSISIDTPGHPDFIAEVERVLGVLDGAVLVVSAVEGVQAQTRILMRALQRLSIPTAVFVNKIDRRGADGGRTLENIKERLTPSVIPMGVPVQEGTNRVRVSPYSELDGDWVSAVTDVLSKNEINDDRVHRQRAVSRASLRLEIYSRSRSGAVHAVYFGSAATGAGVDDLTSHLTDILPTTRASEDGPISGSVFKIERDAANRRVAYTRMFSGSIALRQEVAYGHEGQSSKITGIEVFQPGGAKRSSRVLAGQIAKLQGLRNVRVGDTIGRLGYRCEDRQFPPPTLETSVVSRDASQTLALGRALDQLAEQDPLINVRPEGHGHIAVSLYGEVQKEVIHDTLVADYGIGVDFQDRTTINVERPVGIGIAREVLGKGGNPFLATIGIKVEPAPSGSGVQVNVDVKVDSLPFYVYKSVDEFHDSFRAIVRNALRQGLYGWEVIDCLVTLIESDYTPPGTNASDIRYLTPLVLFAALREAGTAVCEPISELHLELPPDAMGSVSAAVAKSGGAVFDAAVAGNLATLRDEVPTAAIQRLHRLLPGLSHGEGVMEASFARYEAIKARPPARPRIDDNPLNRQEYLGRVTRSGRVGLRQGELG